MVKRYYGGIISATQAVVSSATASGLFSASQQMQAKQAGNWPLTMPTVEYLVVAGGGGGGNGISGATNGGGGGAGGYRTTTGFVVSSGVSITVTVGAGGTGGSPGSIGSNSVFSTITSTGCGSQTAVFF